MNNTISTALFSPAALKVVARLPKTSDPCGKVNFGLKSNQSEHMEVARIDWQKSDKHSIFGRFFVTNLNIPTTFDPSNALTLSRNGQADRVYALSIGSTYLISANVVSSFHIGANRAGNSQSDGPIRHLARTGRERPLQSRRRAAICGFGRKWFQHRRRQRDHQWRLWRAESERR